MSKCIFIIYHKLTNARSQIERYVYDVVRFLCISTYISISISIFIIYINI